MHVFYEFGLDDEELFIVCWWESWTESKCDVSSKNNKTLAKGVQTGLIIVIKGEKNRPVH